MNNRSEHFKGGEKMTLHLFFVTITIKKRRISIEEHLQERKIIEMCEQNRLKYERMIPWL